MAHNNSSLQNCTVSFIPEDIAHHKWDNKLMVTTASKTAHFSCMETSFPGITRNIELLRNLDYIWEDLSRPFTVTVSDQVVAHVGVCEAPSIVDGKLKRFASFHTLCTNPDQRNKGFAEKVVCDAVQYCKENFDNTFVFTNIPTFFISAGFKNIEEHYFSLELDNRTPSQTKDLIHLRVDNPEHINLFKKIVTNRVPLSKLFSIVGSGVVLAFNTLVSYPFFKDLYLTPDKQTILAFQRNQDSLKIFDVISTQQIDFKTLLSYFNFPLNKILFFFSPDQFLKKHEATPIKYEEECTMALNTQTLPKEPFMVPFLSRS